MSPRVRYRFRGAETVAGRRCYVWESVQPLPGDSRHEQIRCRVDWFWSHR